MLVCFDGSTLPRCAANVARPPRCFEIPDGPNLALSRTAMYDSRFSRVNEAIGEVASGTVAKNFPIMNILQFR